MSVLKPGTFCVIIGGCPENIGLIVEVIARLEIFPYRADTYKIRTVSGRPFHQLWSSSGQLMRGNSNECITDRHKLRPLVNPKDEEEGRNSTVKHVRNSKRELVACPS